MLEAEADETGPPDAGFSSSARQQLKRAINYFSNDGRRFGGGWQPNGVQLSVDRVHAWLREPGRARGAPGRGAREQQRRCGGRSVPAGPAQWHCCSTRRCNRRPVRRLDDYRVCPARSSYAHSPPCIFRGPRKLRCFWEGCWRDAPYTERTKLVQHLRAHTGEKVIPKP